MNLNKTVCAAFGALVTIEALFLGASARANAKPVLVPTNIEAPVDRFIGSGRQTATTSPLDLVRKLVRDCPTNAREYLPLKKIEKMLSKSSMATSSAQQAAAWCAQMHYAIGVPSFSNRTGYGADYLVREILKNSEFSDRHFDLMKQSWNMHDYSRQPSASAAFECLARASSLTDFQIEAAKALLAHEISGCDQTQILELILTEGAKLRANQIALIRVAMKSRPVFSVIERIAKAPQMDDAQVSQLQNALREPNTTAKDLLEMIPRTFAARFGEGLGNFFRVVGDPDQW